MGVELIFENRGGDAVCIIAVWLKIRRSTPPVDILLLLQRVSYVVGEHTKVDAPSLRNGPDGPLQVGDASVRSGDALLIEVLGGTRQKNVSGELISCSLFRGLPSLIVYAVARHDVKCLACFLASMIEFMQKVKEPSGLCSDRLL